MNMLETLLFGIATSVEKNEVRRSDKYGTVRPRVLEYLGEHPDSTPNEICTALKLNSWNVDKALAKLLAMGKVEITKPAVRHGRNRTGATWRVLP